MGRLWPFFFYFLFFLDLVYTHPHIHAAQVPIQQEPGIDPALVPWIQRCLTTRLRIGRKDCELNIVVELVHFERIGWNYFVGSVYKSHPKPPPPNLTKSATSSARSSVQQAEPHLTQTQLMAQIGSLQNEREQVSTFSVRGDQP